MDINDDVIDAVAEPVKSASHDWELAFKVLGNLLSKSGGSISSTALRKELERNGVVDARPLLNEMKFFNPESSAERGITPPDFRFYHLGWRFFSEERYKAELKNQERATKEEAEVATREVEVQAEEELPVSRTNRQEEARLVVYVKRALEELYSSDETREERPYVFDVHSSRNGSSFENVDLIAVHWRPRNVCDLVTVEVKLDFNARVVQQALNYTRFSHRAWIAVPVATDSRSELREREPTLFEYAISRGLGILACRRGRGRSYEVYPIHWPLRNQLDPLEEEEFKERYKDEFEEAGIIEREKKPLPRFR
jgi:hypothetical protein